MSNSVPARVPFTVNKRGKNYLAFNYETSSLVVAEDRNGKAIVKVRRKQDPDHTPSVAVYRELVLHERKLGNRYWLLTQLQGGEHPVYKLEIAQGRRNPVVTSSEFILLGEDRDVIEARARIREMAEKCAMQRSSKATLPNDLVRELVRTYR